jgi:Ca2+:H+ antiporter
MYLLFQLKSHAYMYESTPQHIIDEESAPGPVAAWMDSSSSDEDTSSSSDSDGSRGSNTTAGRMKRLMGRRRRRRSAGSRDTDLPAPTRTPSYATSNASPLFPDAVAEEAGIGSPSATSHRFSAIEINDDADDEAHNRISRSRSQSFNEKQDSKPKKEGKHKKKRHHKSKGPENPAKEKQSEPAGETVVENPADGYNEPRCVDFAVPDASPLVVDIATQKKQFSLRGISIRPAIPKTLSQNVFTQPPPSGSPRPQELPVVTGPIPHIRYGIRRTNSLPDRLNQVSSVAQTCLPPSLLPAISNPAIVRDKSPEVENISRTTAVLLLLISTGLVAVCANFMVDSISSVTSDTSLGATFVGLILLPIVGNAAEHVTSVTVAAKNKMDLAIGVAVGSSIQIGMYFAIQTAVFLQADRN